MLEPRIDNIRAWLEKGDATDADWYRNARRYCGRLAKRYGLPTRHVCAVMAALSPGTHWDRNKAEVETLLREHTGRIEKGSGTFTTYPANVDKARGILAAPKRASVADLLALVKPRPQSGHKIGAFFLNIVRPKDTGPVTVDRHAIAIAIGRPPSQKEQSMTPRQYDALAEAYRVVAVERGMVPNAVQAITWAEYRR